MLRRSAAVMGREKAQGGRYEARTPLSGMGDRFAMAQKRDFYDDLETRDPERREKEQFAQIAAQIDHARRNAPYFAKALDGIDGRDVADRAALAKLPIIRKSDLLSLQPEAPPFGGLTAVGNGDLRRVYASPGPIYDAEGYEPLKAFLQANGIRHVLLTGYATDMCFCRTTAGYENLARDFNVFLGYKAGYNETGSNKLYIANGPSDDAVLMYGDFAADRIGINTTNPQGTLDVNGTIYQRGSRLHADYVFQPNYRLESIEKHAAFMWREKHLSSLPKAVVDTQGNEVINVGDHRRGVVEELEKAHIYIDQLNEKNKALSKNVAQLEERIARLEKLLAVQ